MKIPYRNTRQIFQAAYPLQALNPLVQELLIESGEAVIPDLDNENLRAGEMPKVLQFRTHTEEQDWVVQEIQALILKGLRPNEIAILHTKRHVLQAFQQKIPQSCDIQVDELLRQTGMEYRAVFIPHLAELFDRNVQNSYEQDTATWQSQLYTGMTRARDFLYLTSNQKWPKEFDPIRPFVEWKNVPETIK